MWPVEPIRHLDRHVICDWLAVTGPLAITRNQGLVMNFNLRLDCIRKVL